MTTEQKNAVHIHPWSESDLPLLERLMGVPSMTEHLGGPESPEKIRERHERYCRLMDDSSKDRMFVIVVGPEKIPAGSIGYWEKEWQGHKIWETGWSVLPEFQGQGIATKATLAIIEQTRAIKIHRFLHAFPSVNNASSNAICRKAGFTLLEEADFEYPPGHMMRCNDWSFELFPDISNKAS